MMIIPVKLISEICALLYNRVHPSLEEHRAAHEAFTPTAGCSADGSSTPGESKGHHEPVSAGKQSPCGHCMPWRLVFSISTAEAIRDALATRSS